MAKTKPLCKYGVKCYRKNPQHFEEYDHGLQDDMKDDENEDGMNEVNEKRGKTKARAAAENKQTAAVKETTAKKRSRVDDFGDRQEEDEPRSKKLSLDSTDTQPGTSNATAAVTAAAAARDADKTAATEEPGTEKAESVEDVAPEPADIQENIKSKFLVDMPQDFYDFWEFAKSISAQNPADAFVSTLGLHLVGPYDVLAGKTRQCRAKRPNYLLHWRYYYDPPEFLTLLRGDDKKQLHFGYFRDDPKELPSFVAWNEAAVNSNIKPCGENLFAAVSWFIDEKLKKDGKSTSLSGLLTQLKSYAAEKGFTLEQRTTNMKARDKKIVAKCFHGAGIVVPVDKNGVGYRPLPETPANLKKLLQLIVDSKTPEERDKHFDALTEIITFIQFANDECDYGEGLELGLDVFCFGSPDLHSTVLGLLPLAYRLLRREPYAKIIEAHIADRRKSPVSSLDELA